MHSRYTRALTTLALTGAIAVPAVAQAQGRSDDPANHDQAQHQLRHDRRHDRVDNDRSAGRHDRVDNDRRERRHDRGDNDRRDGRGSDDGANHR
jgi:hypothetical protein